MSATIAQVDVRALASNLSEVRRLVGREVTVLAIVKADGYGHGSVLVARTLAGAGVSHFGVASLNEGMELRRAGIGGEILVLGGVWKEEIDALIGEKLTAVVTDASLVGAIADRARALGRVVPLHLKIDTGMTRLGVAPEEAGETARQIRAQSSLLLEGILTHFCNAESVTTPITQSQLEKFKGAVAAVRNVLGDIKWVHAANSAAVLSRPDTHFNMVRPGLMLYGISPSSELSQAARLTPVMRLTTRVARVRTVAAGTPIGYGSTFVTRRTSVIATLAVGYADGYIRCLSNRASVLIAGRRAPVVGRVCMDQTMADVTDCEPPQIGAEAVLWGHQGGAFLSVTEVAQWAGTIPYEMLVRVGKRVVRVSV